MHILETVFGCEIYPILEGGPDFTYEDIKTLPSEVCPTGTLKILEEHTYSISYQVQKELRDNLARNTRMMLASISVYDNDLWADKKAEEYNLRIQVMFREPLENMPLYINTRGVSKIAAWRIKIGK